MDAKALSHHLENAEEVTAGFSPMMCTFIEGLSYAQV